MSFFEVTLSKLESVGQGRVEVTQAECQGVEIWGLSGLDWVGDRTKQTPTIPQESLAM